MTFASTNNQPVLILGMHRSGTSMVTRICGSLGLNLGREESLMRASRGNNEEGFFENTSLAAFNERLLKSAGGAWDRLPQRTEIWGRHPEADRFRAEAMGILAADFAGSGPCYGWKDPRSSLTLPFWKALFPRLRCILCVRHPIAVSASLGRRDGFTRRKSLGLWMGYNASVFAEAVGLPLELFHYESFFEDPKRSVRRLWAFLHPASPPDEEMLSRAAGLVHGGLRHERHEPGEWDALGAAGLGPRWMYELFRLWTPEGLGTAPLRGALERMSEGALQAGPMKGEIERLLPPRASWKSFLLHHFPALTSLIIRWRSRFLPSKD